MIAWRAERWDVSDGQSAEVGGSCIFLFMYHEKMTVHMTGWVTRMMRDHREAMLYIITGGFTTLVNYAAYGAFVWCNIDPTISNVLSWFVSVSFAFVVNKWIVFESRSLESRKVTAELVEFFGARVLTLIVSAVLFAVLFDHLGSEMGVHILTDELFGIRGSEGYVTKLITSFVEIVLNWVLSKYWVFRKAKSEA